MTKCLCLLASVFLLFSQSISQVMALSEASNPAELRAFAQRMEKLENPTHEQLFKLSLAYWWLHDDANVLKPISRAIEAKPDEPEYRVLRGLVLKKNGNFTEALKDFNVAEEQGDREPSLYADRGAVKLSLGDYEGALSDASKAVKGNPSATFAWYVKGTAHLYLKQYSEGVSALSKFIEKKPTDASAYKLRAIAYKALGDTNAAEADFATERRIRRK